VSALEIQQAARKLMRSPAFSAISIALLGLAFGAFACLFSVVYGLLWKPLPFPQSSQLVSLESRVLGIPFNVGVSVPLFDELARSTSTMDAVVAYRTTEMGLRDISLRRSGNVKATLAQPALLSMLGAQPVLGRLLTAEDAVRGTPPRVVISWNTWQQRFAGAHDVIGQRLNLDGDDHEIVGVVAKDFGFPTSRNQVWVPLIFSTDELDRSNVGSFDGLMVIGRMKEGLAGDAAAAELATVARSMPELKKAFDTNFHLSVEPLRSLWIGDRRDTLLLMLLAVSMVWMVTAANVANLSLAQAVARRHETALTAALGASPWQRARCAIAEVILLCGLGVALGFAISPAGMQLLRNWDLLPRGLPQVIGIDVVTLGAVLLLTIALVVALAIARISVQSGNLQSMLRGGSSRHTSGGTAQIVRKSLVVAQVALTVALMFGIGVLLRSSFNLVGEDVGFQRENLIYAGVGEVAPIAASPELRESRIRQIVEQISALPGVEAAGVGSMVPFGTSTSTSSYTPPGSEAGDSDQVAYDQRIDAGYFAALGVQVARGRNFTADEVRSRATVAIVDEQFAKRHFRESDPIGRHFRMDVGPNTPPRELTIVGVVPTIKQRSLDEAADRVSIYQPEPSPDHAAFVVRTSVDPAVMLDPVKSVVQAIASDDAIESIVAMSERIAETLADRSRMNALLGLLAAMAALLAAIGLYAVLAYSVRQRIPEFGVRMALGARGADVLRHVLAQGLVLVGFGIALGLPLAWAFARTLSSRLYRVGNFDPVTLIAVALALGVIGMAACWWPARRAAQVDPVIALRDE
jgi:putative ABC transport system permease protein